MSSNIILLGWNRSNFGCEHGCSNLIIEINRYLNARMLSGEIKSYQVLFPENNGEETSGYFIIYGDNSQLDTLCKTKEWKSLLTRASFYLHQLAVVRGAANEEIMERMSIWSESSIVKVEVDNLM